MTAAGFMASGATLESTFFSFIVTLAYLASSGGLSKDVGALAELSLPAFAISGGVLILELKGIDSRMVGGKYTLFAFLSTDEVSTPAWLRASFHTWEQ